MDITTIRQFKALSHANGRPRILFVGYRGEEPIISSDHIERRTDAPEWLRDWIRFHGFPMITEVPVATYDQLPRPGV